jgi:TolA-binding protein
MAKQNLSAGATGSRVSAGPGGSKLIDKPRSAADLDDTLLDGEAFVRRNRNILIGVAAVVFLAVAGWFAYSYYQRNQNQQAQQYMFPAVYYFEADSLNKALQGDGANDGLLTIADDYGRTRAGELANFYAGAALLKQGNFDEAIDRLRNFSTNDLLVQARAYSLIGDAYMEKGSFADAINYYERAANHEPNEFFTPMYLNKLALAQEANNNTDAAIRTYDQIITQYPNATEATAARKYKSRLEGLVSR